MALSLTVAVIADSMGDAGSGDGQVAASRSWLVLKHCQVVLNPFAEIVVDFRVEDNSARAMILKRWNVSVNFIILAVNIDMILVGGRTAAISSFLGANLEIGSKLEFAIFNVEFSTAIRA